MDKQQWSILLVDDDEDDYVMTRDLLAEIEGGRFRLDWVATYTAALEMIGRQQHDVYLLDYRLGAHNGLGLLREAVAHGCQAPMILLTGQGDRAVDLEAMKAGAADYLVKGQIDAPLLERAIRYAIERKRTEEALQESQRFIQRIANATPNILYLYDIMQQRNIYANREIAAVLGYPPEETRRMESELVQNLLHPDDVAQLTDRLRRLDHTQDGEIVETEYRLKQANGEWRWFHSRDTVFARVDGLPQQILGAAQDVTERKRAEEQLLHDAFHDALTGLPNRALFIDRLGQLIGHTKRHQDYLFAVLFLDLDRFKVVNDSLGHTIGDQLLIALARRVEACLRPGDSVARLGGDEFTILLDDIQDLQAATRVADRLHQELSLPFNLGGQEVYTTASIGIALSTTGYERPEDVLRDADTAMYRAKGQGKARHEVFDQAMHARAVRLLQLETDLRRAVEHGQFQVYYQPIVSLSTGRIAGFEALVRWQHPERGLVSPAEFIPVAEETRLINPIGQWVLGEACRQTRAWQQRFPASPPLSISVNLSIKQFTQPDLIEQIETILQTTGLDARHLKLEITESLIMETAESATEMLWRLKDLGVQLSIDDFGTGYSSLSYLHRFPIDALKIDRSFVSRMNSEDKNSEIVRTIIALARNLGLGVIAEGVETAEQLAQLRLLECEHGQGYLFSKPVDGEAAAGLITAEPQWQARSDGAWGLAGQSS